MHDWNAILVTNAIDFRDVTAAQELALCFQNRQPTAVIYRTMKGWKYGIEGSASHGAGHKFNSEGYYKSLTEFEHTFGTHLPRFEGDLSAANVERNYWSTLQSIRVLLQQHSDLTAFAGRCIASCKSGLENRNRTRRSNAPQLDLLY